MQRRGGEGGGGGQGGVLILGEGEDCGEDLGGDRAGICYVKATDIHPDIPHFTAFLFLEHSNIPPCVYTCVGRN